MHKQTKVGDRHGGSGGTTITGETQPIDTLNKILTLYCNLSLLALRLLPKPVLYTIFFIIQYFSNSSSSSSMVMLAYSNTHTQNYCSRVLFC